jgi:hypothetical protein
MYLHPFYLHPSTFNLLFHLDVSIDKKVNKKLDTSSSEKVTFLSLKSKLIKLLICALENEVDSHNTQLLLGGNGLVLSIILLV